MQFLSCVPSLLAQPGQLKPWFLLSDIAVNLDIDF